VQSPPFGGGCKLLSNHCVPESIFCLVRAGADRIFESFVARIPSLRKVGFETGDIKTKVWSRSDPGVRSVLNLRASIGDTYPCRINSSTGHRSDSVQPNVWVKLMTIFFVDRMLPGPMGQPCSNSLNT
jgi:hypothetical protein